MTEKSYFWTTNGTGDGTLTGYPQSELRTLFHALIAAGEADAGVHADYGDALLATAGTAKVTVGTGIAMVYGFMYHNSGDVDVSITPAVSLTRYDRVVLQAKWSTQTVRITLLEGEEGGGAAPALTQVEADTWEIPLATITAAVGADPVVTDEREYLFADSTGTTETSDATPLTLVLRDANARAKIGAPSAASDIARKDTVDNHAALTGSSAHGAVSAATASQIITRDENGRAKVAAPAEADDIARLDTVSDMLGVKTAHASGSQAVSLTWATVLTLSAVVTTTECDFVVLGQFLGDQAGGTGATIYCRMVLDGSSTGETYLVQSINGLHFAFMYHQVFSTVAAGTHSITLQCYSNYADITLTERRITCMPLPTGS